MPLQVKHLCTIFERLLYACLGLILFGCGGLSASPFINPGPVVEKITKVSGQSLVVVNRSLQGQSGFLWLATNNGLVRFDGHEIKRYQHKKNDPNSLPHNFINELLQDEQGFIWLATNGGGLSRFSPERERFDNFSYDKDNVTTIDSNKLLDIHLSANNKLWIGSRHGINLFDPDTLKNTRLNSQFQPSRQDSAELVTKIYEDSQRRVWYTVLGKGLYQYNPVSQQVTHLSHDINNPNTLDSDRVTAILQTRDGFIWVGTREGLNRLNPDGSFSARFAMPRQQQNQSGQVLVKSLFEDTSGRLWIGTLYNGVGILESTSDTIRLVNQGANEVDSLNLPFIQDINQDDSGTIWISAFSSGLIKLSPDALLFHQRVFRPNLAENITQLFADSAGVLWMGTSKSLYRFDPVLQQFQLMAENIGYILAIAENTDHTLVLAIDEKGIYSFTPETKKLAVYGLDQAGMWSVLANNFHSMHISQQGTLRVGLFVTDEAESGLWQFDDKTKRYTNTLKNQTIESILPVENQLLVATRSRGLKIGSPTGNDWFDLTDNEHDISDLWTLYKDSKERVWVGTDKAGLVLLDLKSHAMSYFTTTQGLPSKTVMNIVEDHQGALWLGTGNGIARLDTTTKKSTIFNQVNGLRVKSIWPKRAARLASGEIVMAGRKSLVRFSPDQLMDSRKESRQNIPVLLSDFRLFNRSMALKSTDPSSPLSQTINETDAITLSHQQSWFSISFVSSNYNASGELRYRYTMQGYSDQWIETDASNRIASFTSLPAGDYIFKVKASNADGSWNDNYRTLNITITPPWWLSWPALASYLLAGVIAIYLTIYWRTHKIQQQALLLERRVDKRTQELKASRDQVSDLLVQKEHMFTNISHEFKTPLTLILNPMESLLSAKTKHELKTKVSMMKRNGQRLLRMVDQLLELSSLELTKTQQRHHYSLKETLTALLNSFQPLLDTKKLSLQCHPFVDVILSLKADSLEIILINLISNAVKYTPDNGTIELIITQDETMISIAVADNGIGISQQDQKIIFNRFVRANERHEQNIPGVGIGLAMVKELVENHDGRLELVSELSRGSTFTVILPISDEQNPTIEPVMQITESSQIEIDALSASTSEPVMAMDEPAPDPTQTTVLVIDDNADMLALLNDTLQDSYQCLLAQNGEKGLEIAKAQLPDLIVCDVMMPGISGYEVVRSLKQDDLTNHIPVILLTAKVDIQSRMRGWSENADEYLEKPFNNTELLMRIENLLAIRNLLRQRYQREFTTSEFPLGLAKVAVVQQDHNALSQSEETAEASTARHINDAFFVKLDNTLQQHYAKESFDVPSLASELAMSPRQLSRKFRALMDLTAVEAIRNYRLQKAVEQLSEGVSPGIVAHQVGFSSHSYFSRCFKAKFNRLPSDFLDIKVH